MEKINTVLVNIDQGMTAAEKQQSRSNIDAQVHTVTAANSKMTLSESDASAALTLPTSVLDIKYPLTFTTTATETKLGMNTSTFMTKAQYDTLQDALSVKSTSPLVLTLDGTLSKANHTYKADEASGVELKGTVFSLKTASATQRGGVMLGDGIGYNASGSLTTTIEPKTVTSGTGKVNPTLINNQSFYNYVPTVTAKDDTYEVNVGINVNGNGSKGGDNLLPPITDIGTAFTGDGDDLSIKSTSTTATVGNNSDTAANFMYISNGTPAKSSGTVGDNKGTIVYMNKGSLVKSTVTRGSTKCPVSFTTDDGITAWSEKIGNLGTGIARIDGEYQAKPSPFFYGNATSVTGRSYNYYDPHGNVSGSTNDGRFSADAIRHAMENGVTTFRFNYMNTYDWDTSGKTVNEILTVPIYSMEPGVVYTYSYNYGMHRRYSTETDHGTYSAEYFFGFGFYANPSARPYVMRPTATAYYYGFLTGACTDPDKASSITMRSPFYVQRNGNMTEGKLMFPCVEYIDYSSSKTPITYPEAFPNDYSTNFKAPSVIMQRATSDWMYWRVLVGNGQSFSTDNYMYDTRLGPMHSFSFMRGLDATDDTVTLFAVSYS